MKRLAIFAHYDDRAQVKPYILHHLRALREVCDAVWFVSTAGLSDEELGKVRPLSAASWTRENVGYDLGMWQDALAKANLAEWDEIVLTNSSVFGPLFPLDEPFARMSHVDCDFWGMTDSTLHSWHLQSYFLVFRARLLHSEIFRDFFRQIVTSTDKLKMIRKYEIGLTTAFTTANFRGAPLISCKEIPRRFLTRLAYPNFNAAVGTPLALLIRRMPYLKVEIFRDNPRRMRLDALFEFMDTAGYDRKLIETDPRPRLPGAKRRLLQLPLPLRPR